MYYSLKTTKNKNSFILTKTTKQNNHTQPLTPETSPNTTNTSSHKQKPETRTQTQLGTHNYNRSLRRAFARAKLLAYFNPDLNTFITLTYKSSTHTPEQTIQDIKNLIKKHNKKNLLPPTETPATPSIIDFAWQRPGCTKIASGTAKNSNPLNLKKPKNILSWYAMQSVEKEEVEKLCEGQGNEWKPFKYIYVMEYQKRGSIHVHMVCNNALEMRKNQNNHWELTDWKKGFSSILTIKDVDNNFKPYLYLFKYMSKAQRIGSSFIHTSKNFDKIETVDYHDYLQVLTEENLLFEEDQEFEFDNTRHRIIKGYFKTSQTDD